MAKITACKCDICHEIFEYGIIQLKGEIDYQRNKTHNSVKVEEGDYCLDCFNEKINQTSVTMMFGDETY